MAPTSLAHQIKALLTKNGLDGECYAVKVRKRRRKKGVTKR